MIVLLFVLLMQSSALDRYVKRGEECMGKQDWPHARASFEQARRIKRTDDIDRRIQIATARLFVEEGDRFLRKGNYAYASDRYGRAIVLDPAYAPAQEKRNQSMGRLACSNGRQMLEKGDLEGARTQFLDCVERTKDAAAQNQLQSLDASLAAAASVQASMNAVNSLAAERQWSALDAELRRLEGSGAVPPAISQYLQGNIDAAAKLADSGSLAEFFAHQRRLHYAKILTAPISAAYLLTLLASMYFGIRRALP